MNDRKNKFAWEFYKVIRLHKTVDWDTRGKFWLYPWFRQRHNRKEYFWGAWVFTVYPIRQKGKLW